MSNGIIASRFGPAKPRVSRRRGWVIFSYPWQVNFSSHRLDNLPMVRDDL